MFESNMIVQSAVSAFNNAALFAPAFLWWAILALPLFVLVYFCGDTFLKRFGWNESNITKKVSLFTVMLTLGWIVLFGGNYGVLRDDVSVLPFLIASIVFVSSIFIGSYRKTLPVPKFRDASRGQKWAIVAGWLIVLLAVGLSDIYTWWGPGLQIGALLLGLLLGRFARSEMRPVAGTLLVITATTVAVLMQPEFFRFGQLGALTSVHLLFLILFGGAVAATMALRNVNTCGAIRHGVYIKLKWLTRFISALCIALFVLTESVLVFISMMLVLLLMFALSVWHTKGFSSKIKERMFAVTLILFGVITVMPAVTALGILYWVALPRDKEFWRELRVLL